MDKTCPDAVSALQGLLFDGMRIMSGGFGLCGIPEHSLRAIRDAGVRNLTLVSNNGGLDDIGVGILLKSGQVTKMICSYVGENRTFEDLVLRGAMDVEFTPQGTLAERIRAGGAGIAAFFTPTGADTVVADGKEVRLINGKTCVLEHPLTGDLSIVKAWRGDRLGNLIYRKTSRNFNPLMAMAGRVTVAEVEELVEPGALDPDHIHTPGIFVHRIFEGADFEKRIEFKMNR